MFDPIEIHDEPEAEDVAEDEYWMPEVVEMPIDGTLDLHTFSPKDVKELVPDYLKECRDRGILEVRIIHGKGKGTLRRTVHSILDRTPEVESYALAGPLSGGWGATQLLLKAKKTQR